MTENQTQTTVDYEHVLDALHARELCNGGPYMTRAEATEQYLDFMAMQAHSSAEARAVVERGRELLAAGERYFADGYRLKSTARQVRGLHFDVPDNAIVWRVVRAGHIAGSEAERLQYVIKR